MLPHGIVPQIGSSGSIALAMSGQHFVQTETSYNVCMSEIPRSCHLTNWAFACPLISGLESRQVHISKSALRLWQISVWRIATWPNGQCGIHEITKWASEQQPFCKSADRPQCVRASNKYTQKIRVRSQGSAISRNAKLRSRGSAVLQEHWMGVIYSSCQPSTCKKSGFEFAKGPNVKMRNLEMEIQ